MKTSFFIIATVFIILISCSKENTQIKDYQQTWKLVSSSGGLHGNGFDLNFDFLKIDQDDKFEIIANNNVLAIGSIKLSPDSNYDYKVEFQDILVVKSSSGYLDLVEDPDKYFTVSNDSLFINTDCCDRYDSVYIKE